MNIAHKCGLNCCRYEADNQRDMSIGNVIHNMIFDTIEVHCLGSKAARSPPSLDSPPSADVAELCGGAADTAYMLVRRGFVHGLSFDLTVGFNLKPKQDRRYLWSYIQSQRPTIMMTSTPCAGMKGFAALSRVDNPVAYHRS